MYVHIKWNSSISFLYVLITVLYRNGVVPRKGLPRLDEGVARLYSRHLYEYVCIYYVLFW